MNISTGTSSAATKEHRVRNSAVSTIEGARKLKRIELLQLIQIFLLGLRIWQEVRKEGMHDCGW